MPRNRNRSKGNKPLDQTLEQDRKKASEVENAVFSNNPTESTADTGSADNPPDATLSREIPTPTKAEIERLEKQAALNQKNEADGKQTREILVEQQIPAKEPPMEQQTPPKEAKPESPRTPIATREIHGETPRVVAKHPSTGGGPDSAALDDSLLTTSRCMGNDDDEKNTSFYSMFLLCCGDRKNSLDTC